MQLVWKQLDLFPDADLGTRRLAAIMGDKERARRTGSQWLRAVISYLEFRSGDSWRRLSDPQERNSSERWWYLDGLRTVLEVQGGLQAQGISLVQATPAKAEKLADDFRVVKLQSLSRVDLAMRLMQERPELTNLKLLSHLQKPKLARMLVEAKDRNTAAWRATA